MKTLNVAMIGYGFMGKAHSNAWRQVGRFFDLKAAPRMKLLCGRTPDALRAAAARYGWEETCTDWREAVSRPDIDAVDITTINDTHAEIALAAAKAGKAILCEKPLAMTVAQCERMVAAVKKARVTNMICHNYRRIPAIAQAAKMIAAGDLGEIHHFRARYLQDWIVDPKFPIVWRLQGKMAGSGSHGDLHAHLIDMARFLVGEFGEVTGMLHTFIKERPVVSGHYEGLTARAKGGRMGKVTVDDAVLCLARFRNGALGNLEATRFAPGRKNGIQVEVNGSKGSVYFDFEDMNRLKYYDGADPADRRGFRDIIVNEGVHPFAGAWWPPGHIIGYEHTFIHAMADFVNAAARGRPTTPDFVDGLRNQQVLEAVTRSAKSGRWVKLPR
jgi:predicted dehydrogenase